MRVILAGPHGFCAGVNMAIEALDLAIRDVGTPLYVYHEIVHNKWVVDWFRQQGVIFVNDSGGCARGRDVALLGPRRAAGNPPPSGRPALEHDRRHLPAGNEGPFGGRPVRPTGYTILLIGHAGHDEVVGTMGEAPQAIRLLQSTADVDRARGARPIQSGLSDANHLSVDDAERDHRTVAAAVTADRRPGARRHLLRHQNRQEAVRCSPPRPTWCWSSAAATVPTARRLAELARARGVARI